MEDEATGLSVAEAADRLGISRVALRKRLRRGSLRAYKVDGEWRVVLPEGVPPAPGQGQPQGGPEDVPAGGPAGRDSVIAELRERVTEYRERVQFLERLTEHQAGVIADLARRPERLPGSPTTEPQTTATAARSRSWWQRIFQHRGT